MVSEGIARISLRLHRIALPGAPLSAAFNPVDRIHYLMFLKRLGDGRY